MRVLQQGLSFPVLFQICGSLGMNTMSSILAEASLVILALSLEESRQISETGVICLIYVSISRALDKTSWCGLHMSSSLQILSSSQAGDRAQVKSDEPVEERWSGP